MKIQISNFFLSVSHVVPCVPACRLSPKERSGIVSFGRDRYDVVASELRPPLLLYPVLNERACRQMNEPLFSFFLLQLIY